MNQRALGLRLNATVLLLPFPEPPAAHESGNGSQRRAEQNEEACGAVVVSPTPDPLATRLLLERR